MQVSQSRHTQHNNSIKKYLGIHVLAILYFHEIV